MAAYRTRTRNAKYKSAKYAPAALEEVVNYSLDVSEDMIIEVDEKESSELFFLVEEMPKFQGGDIKKFAEYIERHLVLPKDAIQDGITGRVFVQFIIDKLGNITEIKIVRGISPSIDLEVIRVIEASPRWTPGKQRGKPVKVSFTLPINFSATN